MALETELERVISKVPRGWEPRPQQIEIFKQFLVGLEEGKEFFFINAPTGSGKSLVNITLGRYLDDAYIMTPLKSLQQQYMRDFHKFLKEVKGRSNYNCASGVPCNKGDCIFEKMSPWKYKDISCRGKCEWVDVVEAGLSSDLTLFNFYSYLCQTRFAKRFTEPRGAIIVDEAHNLLESLRSLFDLNVQKDSFEAKSVKMPQRLRSIEELSSWIQEAGLENAEKLAKLSPKDDDSNVFRDLLFKFQSILEDPGNYVLGKDQKRYVLRRKKVGTFFHQFLSPYGKVKIFSSATILNPDAICRYLDIDPNKVCYINIDWPIAAENGPISLDLASTAITYRSMQKPNTIPNLADTIGLILDQLHPEDRGVIHCVSHSLKERLMEHFPQRIIDRIVDDITEYRSMKGKVLMGPSFYEGLDLPEEMCRFQILLKIPLPSISDPLVSYLGYEHPEIKDRVVTTMAQAYGRGLRSTTDSCTFYILDAMINYWSSSLPQYMRQAIL